MRRSFYAPPTTPTTWFCRVLVAAVPLLCFTLGVAVTRMVEHGTILPRSAVATIMREVAEYHPVYMKEVEHLVEVPANRREHIQEWLGERVGLALRAPDLGAYGLTFQGARLIAIEGQALAQLIYTDDDEKRIALCVTKIKGRASQKLETLVEDGLKLHGLSKGEHVFLIVGDADYHVIDGLANDLPSLLVRPARSGKRRASGG